MDGWRMYGRKDRWTEGWTDGWMNKRQKNVPLARGICSQWNCAGLTLALAHFCWLKGPNLLFSSEKCLKQRLGRAGQNMGRGGSPRPRFEFQLLPLVLSDFGASVSSPGKWSHETVYPISPSPVTLQRERLSTCHLCVHASFTRSSKPTPTQRSEYTHRRTPPPQRAA